MKHKDIIEYWIKSSDTDYGAMINLYKSRNYSRDYMQKTIPIILMLLKPIIY